MKPIYANLVGAIALTFAIAACVPAADPPPVVTTPTPSPTPTPTPAPPPPVQQPRFDNYLDAPRTPGDWSYAPSNLGGFAEFRTAPNAARFVVWCDRVAGRIDLIRAESSERARTARIVTETSTRILDTRPDSARANQLVARLSPNDPLLDAMAITRGHFAVETEGMPTLYLPAWPEISRVIEDCR